MEEIKFNRKELYALVWSLPMITIAKKYEISDSGLRKIFRKHDIPVPRIGHWQKVAHGRKVRKVEFVEKKSDQVQIRLRLRDPAQPNNLDQKVTPEMYPDVDFTVKGTLVEPDKLTVQAGNVLRQHLRDYRKHNPSYSGLLNCWEGLCIQGQIWHFIGRLIEKVVTRIPRRWKNRSRPHCHQPALSSCPSFVQTFPTQTIHD